MAAVLPTNPAGRTLLSSLYMTAPRFTHKKVEMETALAASLHHFRA